MTDLGLQLQFPVLFWLIIAFALLAAIGFILDAQSSYSGGGGWGIVGVFSVIFGGVVLILLVVAAIPFNPHYWGMYGVEGTVQKVSATVQSDGSDVTQNFVATVSGQKNLFVLDNPRIKEYVGKDVGLVCTVGWVYQGVDQWHCDIRSTP